MSEEKMSGRLESIDALRGLDMLLLVCGAAFLTSLAPLLPEPFGSGLAAHMTHAKWGAWYVYDYIFPTFLFLAGVSWPFSLAGQQARGRTTHQIHMKILWRMLALVALGLFKASFFKFNWEHQRLATVIGRIGIAWAVAALIGMHFRVRNQILLCLAFLVGYWAIIYFIPRPDAVIPPGSTPLSKWDYCICGWVDRNFLTVCKPGHDGGGFATLGMPVTAMFGVLAGTVLRRTEWSGNRRTLVLLGGAAVMTLVGVLWLPWCPNVKGIWTPTYALIAGAIATALMAAFYWLIDVRKIRWWIHPFVVFGMNAITIYMLAGFINFNKFSEYSLGGIAGLFPAQVGKAIVAFGKIVAMWLFLWFLKRKRIFLKV